MKIEFLATLAAVADHGSLAAAAERVNLTPSAVSLQMKQLEAYFGQAILDRSGRNVRLTRYGQELSRVGLRALDELESMRRLSAAPPSGKVKLGIAASALTTLLPESFTQLQQRAPGIVLDLQRGASDQLLSDVKAGRLDAAVIIRPPAGGSSRFCWTPLMDEEYVLVVPDYLAGNDVKKLLRQLPWIRLDRSLLTGRIAARFVDSLLPQHPALLDLPASDVIVAMVESGVGVSVLPRLRSKIRDSHRIREVSLGRSGPVRQMAFVQRASDNEKRTVNAVKAAFVRAAERVNPEE